MSTTISKTAKKYLDIIASGKIEESEIISLRSMLNKDKEIRNVIFSALGDKELELSIGQIEKGLAFLKNAWKTPRGIERKDNPFGYREQEILENATSITLKGFYDAGNVHMTNYLPLYCVNSNDNDFEYYFNGEINIVG